MKLMVKVIAFVMCAVILTVFVNAETSVTFVQSPNIYVWDRARPATVADGNWADSSFTINGNLVEVGGEANYENPELIGYDGSTFDWYNQNYYVNSSDPFGIMDVDIKVNQNLIFNENKVYNVFQYVEIIWAVRMIQNVDSSGIIDGSSNPIAYFTAQKSPDDTTQYKYAMNSAFIGYGTDVIGEYVSIFRSVYESSTPLYNFRWQYSPDFVNMSFQLSGLPARYLSFFDFGIIDGYIGVLPIYAYAWGEDNINWNAIIDGLPDVDFIYNPPITQFDSDYFGRLIAGLDFMTIFSTALIAYTGWIVIGSILHKD